MSIHELKQSLRDVPGIDTLTMTMAFGKQIYGFGSKTISLDASASNLDVMAAIREAAKTVPSGEPVKAGPASAADIVTPSAAAGEASPVSGTSPATNSTSLSSANSFSGLGSARGTSAMLHPGVVDGSTAETLQAGTAVTAGETATNSNTMPVEREGQPVTSIEDNTTAARSASVTGMQEWQAQANATIAPSAALIPPVHAVAPSPQPSSTKAAAMNTGAAHASLSLKQMVDQQRALIQQTIDANMAHLKAGFQRQAEVAASIGSIGDKVHADADDLAATLGQLTNDIAGTVG